MTAAGSPGDEDAAVGEQRGSVIGAGLGHFPDQRPFAVEQVVELGGVEWLISVIASGEKNPAIAQHSGCGMDSARVHVSAGDELLRFVVVNLATGKRDSTAGCAARDQDVAIG